MWWLRSAAGPVMTLPGPAYRSAAISCCKVVGAPVAARYTPGSNPRHGPPERSRCRKRVIGHAGGQRLAAGDHVKLLDEEPVEGIVVQPGRSGHGRIMRAQSDKTSPDKYP